MTTNGNMPAMPSWEIDLLVWPQRGKQEGSTAFCTEGLPGVDSWGKREV